MKKQAHKKKKNPLKRYVSAKALNHLDNQLIECPPSFSYKYDYFIYFLDIFYSLESHNKDLWFKKNSGFAAISSDYFKATITDGTYAKHRNYLKKIGILQIDWGYMDKEAMGYR